MGVPAFVDHSAAALVPSDSSHTRGPAGIRGRMDGKQPDIVHWLSAGPIPPDAARGGAAVSAIYKECAEGVRGTGQSWPTDTR